MTLAAALLLIGISTSVASDAFVRTQAPSPTPVQNSEKDSAKPPDTQPKPATAGQPPTSKPHATKKAHKKRAAPTSCGPTPATTPPSDPPAEPKPCPSVKVIVRQGGATEPSIQLAGGDQAAQKRDAANQMLGSTESNLKKLTGQPLNAAQQDSVAQIRQFVIQSKAAIEAGDMERARTLAWKAELLSEDLLKPQN